MVCVKTKNASVVYRIYTNILEILDINILQFVIICESKRGPESVLQLVVESLLFYNQLSALQSNYTFLVCKRNLRDFSSIKLYHIVLYCTSMCVIPKRICLMYNLLHQRVI